MRTYPRIANPWGTALAAFFGCLGGGLATTVSSSPIVILIVAVGTASTVFAAEFGTRTLLDHGQSRDAQQGLNSLPSGRLPSLPPDSPASQWLRRAAAAAWSLHRLGERAGDTGLRGQIGAVDTATEQVIEDFRRLAGQVAIVEQTLAGMRTERLTAEHARLRHELEQPRPDPVRVERERALSALDEQLDVVRRLGDAREALLARMQSSTLGLESLVARMAELIATHATASGHASVVSDRLAELSCDLEGMRAGLAEAERLSRTAMTSSPRPQPPQAPPNSPGLPQ